MYWMNCPRHAIVCQFGHFHQLRFVQRHIRSNHRQSRIRRRHETRGNQAIETLDFGVERAIHQLLLTTFGIELADLGIDDISHSVGHGKRYNQNLIDCRGTDAETTLHRHSIDPFANSGTGTNTNTTLCKLIVRCALSRLVAILAIGANMGIADRQIVDDSACDQGNHAGPSCTTDIIFFEESHRSKCRFQSKETASGQEYSMNKPTRRLRLVNAGIKSARARPANIYTDMRTTLRNEDRHAW